MDMGVPTPLKIIYQYIGYILCVCVGGGGGLLYPNELEKVVVVVVVVVELI